MCKLVNMSIGSLSEIYKEYLVKRLSQIFEKEKCENLFISEKCSTGFIPMHPTRKG